MNKYIHVNIYTGVLFPSGNRYYPSGTAPLNL